MYILILIYFLYSAFVENVCLLKTVFISLNSKRYTGIIEDAVNWTCPKSSNLQMNSFIMNWTQYTEDNSFRCIEYMKSTSYLR